MHLGARRPALADETDELENLLALLGLVVRPGLAVSPSPVVVAGEAAEEEEESAVGAPEGVALEVEEDVSVVGLGEPFEAPSPLRMLAGRFRSNGGGLSGVSRASTWSRAWVRNRSRLSSPKSSTGDALSARAAIVTTPAASSARRSAARIPAT